MPSMEVRFQTGQSLPIPQLRMRWSRGIPKIEIGYELLSDRFGVDGTDNGSDRSGDCKAKNRDGITV
jgi:hypothetical protein